MVGLFWRLSDWGQVAFVIVAFSLFLCAGAYLGKTLADHDFGPRP